MGERLAYGVMLARIREKTQRNSDLDRNDIPVIGGGDDLGVSMSLGNTMVFPAASQLSVGHRNKFKSAPRIPRLLIFRVLNQVVEFFLILWPYQ